MPCAPGVAIDEKAHERDLADLVSFLAATGCRIGEALAATWANLDLNLARRSGTFAVTGTVVRIKGEGLRIQPNPKSRAGMRRLELPSWCVRMLDARHELQLSAQQSRASLDSTVGLVFPAPLSGDSAIRAILAAACATPSARWDSTA